MEKFLQAFSILLAGLAIGIADAMVKKASLAGSITAAFKSPWMFGAALLYIVQTLFFFYVFSHGWKLGIVSTVQVVFFSLTTIGIGYFFFHESLSSLQITGIVIATIGVILISA